MTWRAWYTDDRVYASSGVTWQQLPAEGLVLLIVYRATGRTTMSGDWYWMEGGEIRRVPPSGPGQPWRERPSVACASCVKRGAYIDDVDYARVVRSALAAPAPEA